MRRSLREDNLRLRRQLAAAQDDFIDVAARAAVLDAQLRSVSGNHRLAECCRWASQLAAVAAVLDERMDGVSEHDELVWLRTRLAHTITPPPPARRFMTSLQADALAYAAIPAVEVDTEVEGVPV